MTDSLQPPDYLSPSSMSTFEQCPLKFKFGRIDRLPEPPTEATLKGNFVHDVLEQLYLLEPKDRTMANAKEIARHYWDEKWEKEVTPFVDGATALREFRWSSWWAIENLWNIEEPSELSPAGLEFAIQTTLDGVPVRGFIDRFTRDDDALTISDYKTGRKPSPRFADGKFFQLMVYAAALEEMGVGKPQNLELLYLSESSKLTASVTVEGLRDTRVKIRSTYDKILQRCETGKFETNKTKLCGWCHFKTICPAWGGSSER